MSEKKHIARAAGILGSATMLSRIMGMIRDMVVSRLFGAGMATDAFFAAFQIPNMLRRFFAEGALTSAFVPTFSATFVRQGEDKARELANICFTLLTIVMAVITIAGILLSPILVSLMFPGFRAEPGKFELTVLLNRLMFPYIFFISIVALFMGILNTLRHFFAPAISTVFLNLSIIISALCLRGFFEVPVTALAIGVLVGGSIQLVIQLPVLWSKGYKLTPNFNFSSPEIRSIALLMLPSTFGVGVYYLNITVSAILASMLPQGSVSYLYYAQRLFEFPQGIFTVSVAQAVLPSMSRQVADDDISGMKETLSFGVRLMLFITIPAMAGLMICSTPIFTLIFMGGAFDYDTAVNSAKALMYYSLGLSFVALTRVLAPVFYALKDTRTPVYTAFLAFVVNLCFSLALMDSLKHGGLALATTISAFFNMILLFWFLRRKIGAFGGFRIMTTASKSFAASLPMSVVVWYGCSFVEWSRPGEKIFKASVLGGSILSGLIVYFMAVKLVRSEEIMDAIALIRRKLRK
ncbi:MAG: murein biosynthesis integral membrane protein MurJ [Desulfuromonadaceae bacterium]|nr:murein biosynthesis integral membrane protein MurJ [Desulfuromonadaceae bacterium]MDD2855700.1 murein biosynthesis integral membrane protein MurJ [Desulfuromonadaceae bacterium]